MALSSDSIKWWHNAVVYQIYPRSFFDANHDGIGDLAGILSKLDYLKTLGVSILWLSPVCRSPMEDNGYDVSDYQDIAPVFGSLEEFDALIAEARDHGIRIMMDMVLNHTSDEHPWFIEARRSRNSPRRDYYVWRRPRQDGSPPDDRKAGFGGSAWAYDEASQDYYFHLFSRRQPDLNWENPEVRTEIYRMMRWWLDRGISGFRLDVIDLIGKVVDQGVTVNGPNLHPYLHEMHRAVFRNRDIVTVGEAWSASPEDAMLYCGPGRDELSMVFSFEHIGRFWHPELGKWHPRPFDLVALKNIISRWQRAFNHCGWNSLFWNNHDLPRVVSAFGDPGRYRTESAKMLATVLHFLKGTPYVYQGEEIGMTNVRFPSIDDYRDIETLAHYRERIAAGIPSATIMAQIHATGRDNARTPMQWSKECHAGFSTVTPWIGVNPNYVDINVEAALANPDSVFFHYQKLIALRKQSPIMVYGYYAPLLEDHPRIFAFQRHLGKERIVVLANFGSEELTVKIPPEIVGRYDRCLVCTHDERLSLENHLPLLPYEAFALAAP